MSRFSNKPVVVPWDFQEMAVESLNVAMELADSKEQIEIVHVMEFPKGVQPSAAEALASGSTQEKLKERFLEQVPGDLQDLSFTIISDFDSEHGVEIANFAENKDAGLIVIGSHGRKGLSRLILGSVADKVVQHSECPVLVVKH
jgi:nucleotide-binding universal stress UspA family protein